LPGVVAHRLFVRGGTTSSNPVPSRAESGANLTFRAHPMDTQRRPIRFPAPPADWPPTRPHPVRRCRRATRAARMRMFRYAIYASRSTSPARRCCGGSRPERFVHQRASTCPVQHAVAENILLVHSRDQSVGGLRCCAAPHGQPMRERLQEDAGCDAINNSHRHPAVSHTELVFVGYTERLASETRGGAFPMHPNYEYECLTKVI